MSTSGGGRHRPRHESPEWAQALGEVVHQERVRQGWSEHAVANRHTRLTADLVATMEQGDGAELPLSVWVALCQALGIHLGHVLVRADEAAGADISGRAWADAPTDVIDLGDTASARPHGQRRLGVDLGHLRHAVGMSLRFAAKSLWWPTSHLRMVEDDEIGVSAAELLGILAVYGVTGQATAEWLRRIPLPCQHVHQSPVWICETCRSVLASVEETTRE